MLGNGKSTSQARAHFHLLPSELGNIINPQLTHKKTEAQTKICFPKLNSQHRPAKGNASSPLRPARATPVLPGHKHSSIHGGCVILPPWDLIIAQVPSASVFLILPVTEALQGPLPMVSNGQLDLKEIQRGVREMSTSLGQPERPSRRWQGH